MSVLFVITYKKVLGPFFAEMADFSAAEEEKKAAEAAAAAASQEKRRAENEIRIKDAEQRELQRNETATKFKQLFFDYKPKDPENELKDEDVKQKLLYLPAGPGDTYQLRIPEFAEMTDDKYKDLIIYFFFTIIFIDIWNRIFTYTDIIWIIYFIP